MGSPTRLTLYFTSPEKLETPHHRVQERPVVPVHCPHEHAGRQQERPQLGGQPPKEGGVRHNAPLA
jgi:hypothetical protein